MKPLKDLYTLYTSILDLYTLLVFGEVFDKKSVIYLNIKLFQIFFTSIKL